MAILRMSTVFAQCADELPAEEKVKLTRVLMLLTDNPGHPLLQLQKMAGARRCHMYQCRLDTYWKIILERRGEMLFDLIYVGRSDAATRFGETLREEPAPYGLTATMQNQVASYLAGSDEALQFVPFAAP